MSSLYCYPDILSPYCCAWFSLTVQAFDPLLLNSSLLCLFPHSLQCLRAPLNISNLTLLLPYDVIKYPCTLRVFGVPAYSYMYRHVDIQSLRVLPQCLAAPSCLLLTVQLGS